ncbi:SpoIIIAC/SpoIIIAD family protein [Caldanaerobacter subterraneus]|uniref:Stage III sporulation AC family protein n=1 Tax=Caldanaerobacter subterraneus TaxID=911092 RepID=A0A7Y2L829_9THEO|nr:SpoIIIAC/SpoIIIAD family protein [Caldanaerobacter subterraneus]NNG67543.1 stage III sporulation AC family protein [Caldanaerobacter subterraneus]
MEVIAKIFGLGIVVIVADKVLSEAGQKNLAFFVTLIGVVIGLAIVVPKIYQLFNDVRHLFNIY